MKSLKEVITKNKFPLSIGHVGLAEGHLDVIAIEWIEEWRKKMREQLLDLCCIKRIEFSEGEVIAVKGKPVLATVIEIGKVLEALGE